MPALAQISPQGEPSESLERRLVSEVLRKDRKATAEFVARCADWVYPFVCRKLVPRTEMVDDIVQEILLAAWQNLAHFRGDAGLRAWILGIARHKVEDYYRKRLRDIEVPEDENQDAEAYVGPAIEAELDAAAQQTKVERTLAQLPESYALALLWRYRDEKSAAEMAQLTGKTEKAMERLLARARENFRKRWNDE